MHTLRVRIAEAQARRRQWVAEARHNCKAARVALRERQAIERAELRYNQRGERIARRGSCESTKAEARATGGAQISAERSTLRRTAAEQKAIDRAGKAPRVRSTSRERAQENDDAVRSNLPADLVPVFDSIRKTIKGSARRSRTEAFLEWAEENPGEVVAVQQRKADRYLAELLAEQKKHHTEMRKTGRHREAAKRLADVPF